MPFEIQDDTTDIQAPPAEKPAEKPVASNETVDAQTGEKIRVVYRKPPLSEKKLAHMRNMTAKRMANKGQAAVRRARLAELEARYAEEKAPTPAPSPIERQAAPVAQPAEPKVDIDALVESRVQAVIQAQKEKERQAAAKEVDINDLVEQKIQALMNGNGAVTPRANQRIERPEKARPPPPEPVSHLPVPTRFDSFNVPASSGGGYQRSIGGY